MATRRRVNPELMRAFESSQVEPFDFETPGRVIDVPLPPEHFEQPQAPAPVAPRSRFDVVRDYLEQSRQPMPQPTTPEVDMRGAADFDNRRNFGQSMLAAGQAFTGNRRAMPQVSNAAETQAMGERDARKRELEQWAANKERQRMGEAALLSSAAIEPREASKSARTTEQIDRELDIKEQDAETRRLNATKVKPSGGGKKADGKTLPVSEVGELSSLPVAEEQVDRLGQEFERLEMGGMKGRASGAVTDALGLRWTDSAEYNAAASLAMQAAGKIMEGGKLAAGDELKYKQMLPRPGDGPDVVKQKLSGMKAFLRSLASARAKGLRESGYNVPESLFPQPEKAGPTKSAAPRTAVNKKTGERRVINPDGSLGEVVP